MQYSDTDFEFVKVGRSSFQKLNWELLYIFFYLILRLIRTGADKERGSESSSITNGGEGLVSKEGLDVFLSTSKLSSPWRVRSLNWFTLVSPESCRYLRSRYNRLVALSLIPGGKIRDQAVDGKWLIFHAKRELCTCWIGSGTFKGYGLWIALVWRRDIYWLCFSA